MPEPSVTGARRGVRLFTATLVTAAIVITLAVPGWARATNAEEFRRHVERIPTTPLFGTTLRRTLAESRNPRNLDAPLALAAAGDASKAGTPRYLIRLLAPLADRNYGVLQFDAASGPGGGAFDAVTFRFDSDSNSDQTYIFDHRAPASAVRVFAGTRRARLLLDTNLADVDLRFTPTHDTHERIFGCDTFLAPEASMVTWTVGRLNGRFDFTPNETYLQTHSTTVRAAVERIVPTGRHCPVNRGVCPRQWNFWFGDADSNVTAFEGPPGSEPDIFGVNLLGGSVNDEWRMVFRFAYGTHPVARPDHEVVFRGGNLGPFFSGNIAFERGRALPHRAICRATGSLHRFSWSRGTFGMRFDARPVELTGSRLYARSILIYHPHA